MMIPLSIQFTFTKILSIHQKQKNKNEFFFKQLNYCVIVFVTTFSTSRK